MIQRRVIIKGQVQGVGFRAATLREAKHNPGLRGYVRNLSHGEVEAVFVGEESCVLKLVAWCQAGPASARVTEIEVYEEKWSEELPLFSITRE